MATPKEFADAVKFVNQAEDEFKNGPLKQFDIWKINGKYECVPRHPLNVAYENTLALERLHIDLLRAGLAMSEGGGRGSLPYPHEWEATYDLWTEENYNEIVEIANKLRTGIKFRRLGGRFHQIYKVTYVFGGEDHRKYNVGHYPTIEYIECGDFHLRIAEPSEECKGAYTLAKEILEARNEYEGFFAEGEKKKKIDVHCVVEDVLAKDGGWYNKALSLYETKNNDVILNGFIKLFQLDKYLTYTCNKVEYNKNEVYFLGYSFKFIIDHLQELCKIQFKISDNGYFASARIEGLQISITNEDLHRAALRFVIDTNYKTRHRRRGLSQMGF